MRKTPKTGPSEALVRPLPAAPKDLKKAGRDLWTRIQQEYGIRDSGGLELLAQACQAADRIADCGDKIAREGLTIATASGTPKEHPLLKYEVINRAFLTRTLHKLGLDVEPVHGPGRPPGRTTSAWVPPDEDQDWMEDEDGRHETNSH
jgi:P27 family predicted phage terminase small subunit